MENPELINRLRQHEHVENPGLDSHDQASTIEDSRVEYATSVGEDERYIQIMQAAIRDIENVFAQVRAKRGIPLDNIERNLVPALSVLAKNMKLSSLMMHLQNKDDYTLRHSIAVGILSLLQGEWMKMDDRDQKSLLISGLLHDIGKAMMSDEILNKPEKLTDYEFKLMKKHTVFGYHLLEGTVGISHRQALVALEHHERIDGSGYPLGINGDKITLFSKIVAVSDVYHAMSTVQVYRHASPIYQVLSELQHGEFGQFDHQVIEVFINNMMESLIGCSVQLSTGQIGEIVWINPVNALRPMVKVGEEILDLSAIGSIYIAELI